jgi:hypothetical protein
MILWLFSDLGVFYRMAPSKKTPGSGDPIGGKVRHENQVGVYVVSTLVSAPFWSGAVTTVWALFGD